MPDYILPPKGYIWYARRLNRHRYHLTKKKGAPTLCGVDDESSVSTMDGLLPHDSYKACRDCIAKAGRPLPGGPLGDPDVEELAEMEDQRRSARLMRDETQLKLTRANEWAAKVDARIASLREKLGDAAPPPAPEMALPF